MFTMNRTLKLSISALLLLIGIGLGAGTTFGAPDFSSPTVTNPAASLYTSATSYSIKGTASPSSLVAVCIDADNDGAKDPNLEPVGIQKLAKTASSFSITVPLAVNSANHFVVTAPGGNPFSAV